jgi:3-dehydroquinate synthetase
MLARADAARVRSLLDRAGLPVTGPALSAARITELMQVDKKAAAGRIRFVLLSAIGAAEVRSDIDEKTVRDTIAACTTTAAVAASQ